MMVRLPIQRLTPAPRIRSARRRQWLRLLPAILAPVFGTGLLSPRHAAANDWINSAGGTFGVLANWNPTRPNAGDLANFNLNNTYTVTFNNANPNNGSLTLSAGNVTFETALTAAQTYTLTSGTSISGGTLTLGPGQAGNFPLTLNASTFTLSNASMFVNSSNNLTTAAFNLAAAIGGGTGNLTVDASNFTASGTTSMGLFGGAANLTFQNSAIGSFADISMANSGFTNAAGHLTIQSGSAVTTAGNLFMAPNPISAQSATILVDGTSSTFTQTGTASILIGAVAANAASITLTNGGRFSSGTGAISVLQTGAINVANGTFNANGSVTLIGGSLSVGLGSNFNLAPGKNLTAQNGANVSFTHNVAASGGAFVPAGSTFTVQSGAHLSSNDYFDIGDEVDSPSPAVATLIVDGSGSSFIASDDPFWGGDGGSASVTIRNNATASVNSLLEIARTFAAGTTGTVNLQSGAQLTVAGDLRLAADGGNATGSIFITDATLTQTSGGALILGNPSGTGNATLTLNNATGNGGTFTSSTGGISINKNAAININSGVFNANGDVTLNGGTLYAFPNVILIGETIDDTPILGSATIFNLAPGKNLTAQNGASVTLPAFYTLPGGSTFTIQSGSHLLTDVIFDVGNAASSNSNLATLIIDGTGSSFASKDGGHIGVSGGRGSVTIRNNATASIGSSTHDFFIAASTVAGTSGILNVQSGAQLTVNSNIFVAADGGNATGSIFITDATLTQASGALILGSSAGAGTATLTINNATGNGGTFTSSTAGITVNKNATINLTSGTFNANGNVTIDGGSLQVGTAGAFKLAAGKTLTAQNSAHVHFTGDPVLGGGSTFSILSGASLIADAALTIANTTNATLSVDGSGSALSAGTDSHWGFFGGIATITFSHNATASITGNLFLGSGGPFSTANVAVLTNAHLTTTSLTMANLGSQTVATLTVAGTGSSVTVTSGMTIGAPAMSTATLFINSGGTFTMGIGTNIINATGIVNINSGTFIANGGLSDQGALNIGNGGTTGDYVGTSSIGVIGSLTFNRSNAFSLNAPLQGTGTLTQAGAGTTTLTGAYTATGPVKITAGKLVFGSTNAPRQTSGVVIKMQSLTMGSTQVLDMTNHDLIIGNTNYATVQNQILSAFGAASGPAITTSTSNVLGHGPDNTLPIPIDPAAFGLTSWDNVAITDPNSMIVKYTIFGDATLDGVVNGDDYSVIAGNFGQTTPGASDIITSWLMGDVTLDGVVNGDDYSVLAGNFGEGPMGSLDAPAAGTGGTFTSDTGGTSAVPEPTSLALLGIAAGALLIRRRK